MTFSTLALTLLFVLIPLLLAYFLKLNLEKDIVIATIRSIIQLLAVEYVLQYVFEAENFIYTVIMIALIIGAATHNAQNKGAAIKGITWKLVVTFLTIEILTQGSLIGLDIIPATPQYVIPISGVVIGNARGVAILLVNGFIAEIE